MQLKIKQSYACATVQDYSLNYAMTTTHVPTIGDVGIFRVVDPGDSYLVDQAGYSRDIFEDDLLMLAFGNRYATNNIEGYVPNEPVNQFTLLGRGGVAGVLKSCNATVKAIPASLKLEAYAVDHLGRVCNTIQNDQLQDFDPTRIKGKIILSIGASMDSGKTTTAAFLCGGLSKAGHPTAYMKLTGTAFPKDARFVEDRGADFVIDFTAFGYPSTFLCGHEELLNLYQALVTRIHQFVNAEYIVVEIADGILQQETAALLKDPRFMQTVHAVVYSSGDSLGVISSLELLAQWGIRPVAVSGLFTASDLLVAEAAPLISVPILNLQDLLGGKIIPYLPNPINDKTASGIMEWV